MVKESYAIAGDAVEPMAQTPRRGGTIAIEDIDFTGYAYRSPQTFGARPNRSIPLP